MMKSRTIIGVSKKMQTAVRHLATLRVLRNLIIAVANISLFTLHSSLLSSCDREPLELYKKGDSKVDIFYDWSYYKGPTPNGIYVMYAKNGDKFTYRYPTHDMSGKEDENVDNGSYKQLVMTNTFAEYEGNMRFYDTDDFEKIRVQSEYYNITNQDAWDKGMRYMEEPMSLGVAIDSFEVKTGTDGLIFYEYDKDSGVDSLNQQRQDTIRPMTTTLTIRVKVRGINYMKPPEQGGVDGYITGLANGCSLTKFWRSTEVGNIKLNNWRIDGYESRSGNTTRAGDMQVGWIATDIQTFGLPHGRELLIQRSEKSNYIKLHFTSLDGTKTTDFSYDVGKMLRYDGDDGTQEASFTQADVSLQLELEIDAPLIDEEKLPTLPYSQPEGSGQFDAQVEDWGDDQNVDVPM